MTYFTDNDGTYSYVETRKDVDFAGRVSTTTTNQRYKWQREVADPRGGYDVSRVEIDGKVSFGFNGDPRNVNKVGKLLLGDFLSALGPRSRTRAWHRHHRRDRRRGLERPSGAGCGGAADNAVHRSRHGRDRSAGGHAHRPDGGGRPAEVVG